MTRRGSVMKLYPGQAEEYKRRHDMIWPELVEGIRRDGGRNYTIFHDPKTDLLFSYLEIEDEERWAVRRGDEWTKKWWDYMADIMDTNPDNSPYSRKLNEMFHLD